MPVISSWANAGHGLDALLNPWNVVLGLAVFFLARILSSLYFINNISDADLVKRCRRALWGQYGLVPDLFPVIRHPHVACRGLCGESGERGRSLWSLISI